jgi:hypothetical protein
MSGGRIMGQRRRLRSGILSSVGAVVVLVLGQGVASAAERSEDPGILSAALDDPIGTVTNTLDDPIDEITDIIDGTTDTVTDTTEDPIGTIGETVDDTVDAVDGAVGGQIGAATDALADTSPGTTDGSAGEGGAVGGASDEAGIPSVRSTADTSSASSAFRARDASAGPRVAAMGPSDLDELAGGGNDVVEGPGDPVCVGTARVVCVGLVGGLGALGILFPAEEARAVVDAFVDVLARTGVDLQGAAVAFGALMLIGIVLVSRRPSSVRAGTDGRSSTRDRCA